MLRKSLPYLLRNPKNKEKRLILNFRINTNGRKGNLISIINRHCHSYISVHFVYSLSLLLFKIQTLISSVSHWRFEIVSDWTKISAARFSKSLRFAIASRFRFRIRISLAMIAPTFVMIESILSLRQCYQSNLLSLGFADGSAFRFWKFVFCYVFDKGFWNNWIVFSISCYCLKASFAQFQDSSLGFL